MSDISQLGAPAPRTGDQQQRAAVGAWAVVIPGRRYEAERLFHHDTLELTGLADGPRPAPGDEVLVVTDGEAPVVVALARVAVDYDGREGPDGGEPRPDDGTLVLTYTRRAFDEPLPADGLTVDGLLTRLDPVTFRDFAGRLAPLPEKTTWLVSIDLPIEAPSPAEAVRLFWSYVMELGPRELPAFVSPSGDELAMQAFVLGDEANLDPEEDED
ncbi:hypothetical protein SAMN05444365_101522 [Micromonospora pattaloongensis]|uniref:Uncharacterized protein n=1 Tax=Micromonospora pattaloongensis TaxID=405436 RepID=A0A1H3GRE4_9ACTN|nr:hypothetical protein [Micromonospora pattaloongensis]SDY05630.1 hypothetical protein SAMN05444365_101522 [Micromonospora pattaloongensis]